jgi:hypothetical protein
VLGPARVSLAQLYAGALAWVTAAGLYLFLYWPPFGRAMRAGADDLDAAMAERAFPGADARHDGQGRGGERDAEPRVEEEDDDESRTGPR